MPQGQHLYVAARDAGGCESGRIAATTIVRESVTDFAIAVSDSAFVGDSVALIVALDLISK